jgi:DNA-binding LytR/AlgR family response regulator
MFEGLKLWFLGVAWLVKGDMLEIVLSDLLLIESVGDYIKAYHLDKGRVTGILIRSTLKRIESQLKVHLCLVKCHRAFFVNIKHIEQVKGNSQGLKLMIAGIDFEIPVSRNYSVELKEQMHAY